MGKISSALKKISLALSCAFSFSYASQLKSDEYVAFVPSVAYDFNSTEIAVEIKAFVYEKEGRPFFNDILAAFIGANIEDLEAKQKERFYERSALFKIDYEGGKEFATRFNNKSVYKMPTTKDGKSEAIVKIQKPNKLSKLINFEVDKPKYPKNVEKGYAVYASSEGVAAIFDIDDTIKDSNVLDKKALLANTFFNEYKAVDGAKEIFESIKSLDNPSFHYVSASPAQLYPALKEFFDKEGFPIGSFHLRDATDFGDFVADKERLMEHKRNAIEKLFKAYPKRRFILVGDSGENDPEVYAEFNKKYPDRVIKVIIHNITNENKESARFKDITNLTFY
ncbi:MAG: App1 family protein [Helicobacteraceae bacterium]|jgi:phosphatidate phosphatase APP1|nr:App1 family protein [Helicobacteraceae bacterium]